MEFLLKRLHARKWRDLAVKSSVIVTFVFEHHKILLAVRPFRLHGVTGCVRLRVAAL